MLKVASWAERAASWDIKKEIIMLYKLYYHFSTEKSFGKKN